MLMESRSSLSHLVTLGKLYEISDAVFKQFSVTIQTARAPIPSHGSPATLPTAQDPISGSHQEHRRMLVSNFHGGADMAAQPRPAPIPREVPNAQGWSCLGALGWGSGVSLGCQALLCCPVAFPEAPYTPFPGSHQPLLSSGADSSVLSSCCLALSYRSGC